jgi:hypothetical protein
MTSRFDAIAAGDVELFLAMFGTAMQIDGETVTAVLDTDERTPLTGENAEAGSVIRKVLQCREGDVTPVTRRQMIVDAVRYFVDDFAIEAGMLVIKLSRNAPR